VFCGLSPDLPQRRLPVNGRLYREQEQIRSEIILRIFLPESPQQRKAALLLERHETGTNTGEAEAEGRG